MRHVYSVLTFCGLVGAVGACGVTAPADIGGSYGALPVEDDDGKKLLTEGDDGDQDPTEDEAPPAEEGQTDPSTPAGTAIFPNGTVVVTTSALNLRKGPSTDTDVLRAMAEGASVTVTDGIAQGGFIAVTQDGLAGFASYRYLRLPDAEAPATDPDPGTSSSSSSGSTPVTSDEPWRTKALAIAANGVGFSYFWGHGKLLDGPLQPGYAGSCSGSCPSCSHSGAYGADCSGFVAKAWVVPASNSALDVDTHPYSTSEFYSGTGNGKWQGVSKSAVQSADAMVYRSGSAGHIFLYEKGDAWGQPWTFEARGCSYGIVHNIRTSGSAYKAISLVAN